VPAAVTAIDPSDDQLAYQRAPPILNHVMRGLVVPRIHVFGAATNPWMAGPSPAMTRLRFCFIGPRCSQELQYLRRTAMAMDGRAGREGRTSFYAELRANLGEQTFQLAHFSFETRDVGFHCRELGDAKGWRLSR
jgi:hypothetical protein